jgi:hypothetical protein
VRCISQFHIPQNTADAGAEVYSSLKYGQTSATITCFYYEGQDMKKLCVCILIVVIILGGAAFAAYRLFLVPPTELEVYILLERWKAATEAGDWDAVWALMGQPSTKVEAPSPHSSDGSKATFIEERQTYHPGLLRCVRIGEKPMKRMTHVDDMYTFQVTVDIDYVDSDSGAIVDTETLRFYVTKRNGRLGIWDFEPPNW